MQSPRTVNQSKAVHPGSGSSGVFYQSFGAGRLALSSRKKAWLGLWAALAGVSLLAWSTGCSPALPTVEEQIAFDKAADPPMLDIQSLPPATMPAGPYRLAEGDLLEFQMPQVLRAVFPDAPSVFEIKPIRCRVSDNGTICLPSVGEIKVQGKTLYDIEAAVVNAYHPKYLRERPTIVAQIVEYRTAKVTIVGGVTNPGVYDLRSDEMSLAAALMKAGGIVKDGSGLIRVNPTDQKEILLPVAGMNIPAMNMALTGGETITVEKLPQQVVSVVGLVKKPGVFPYPPDAKYSLLQVLGFAGGLDEFSEPDFLRVCRQDGDGKCVSVVIKVGNDDMPKASTIMLHPGDTVFVEQTHATRTRRTVTSILQKFGMYVGGSYPL
jgi:polysaccharide biosynthesis/export protein